MAQVLLDFSSRRYSVRSAAPLRGNCSDGLPLDSLGLIWRLDPAAMPKIFCLGEYSSRACISHWGSCYEIITVQMAAMTFSMTLFCATFVAHSFAATRLDVSVVFQ
jgi:hypothetical protein